MSNRRWFEVGCRLQTSRQMDRPVCPERLENEMKNKKMLIISSLVLDTNKVEEGPIGKHIPSVKGLSVF